VAKLILSIFWCGALCALLGCNNYPTLPSASSSDAQHNSSTDYLIGPGDSLNVSVWRNPELSTTVPVRPDGRISIPLVDDVVAAGKTPTQLARELETKLKPVVKDPIVTVEPTYFVGIFSQQVRVIGEAVQPHAVPYRANMTALDVMIEVGGLTKYAAGNRAVIVRRTPDNKEEVFQVYLDDLMRDGDMKANVYLQPGDILTIPQGYF
jgi:polysaccharide biosynthesis/export protein